MKNKSTGDLMLDIFDKLHPKKVVMLLMLVLLSFVAFTQTPPKVYNYKGKDYTILHGPKGGHYIILEDKTKHYLPTLDVDDKTGEVTYKGVKYKPQLGPKGGRFIVTDTGFKIYLPHS